MRLLLDSHALYWWWEAPERFNPATLDLLRSADTIVFASVVSLFELANKARVNKLATAILKLPELPAEIEAEGFGLLSVSSEHALLAGQLPGEHRDPFDRLLAAQSLVEKLALVSCDRAVHQFGCEVVW